MPRLLPSRRTVVALICLVFVAASLAALTPAAADQAAADRQHEPKRSKLRVAAFNAAMNRDAPGDLRRDLKSGTNSQAKNNAEIIQRTRPDVLVLQEFDYDPKNPKLFSRNYLERSQNGAKPISYPYRFTAPVNTGVPTGFDLDRDGKLGGPGDAQGFGTFEGQYGMVVYSRYPIDTRRIRTFQNFLWKDMPGALLPKDPATGKSWYTGEELDQLRLSSKSHWDVPVRVGRQRVNILTCHPTPPVFDGPEDRNGRRNFDEIRFFADYISAWRSRYIYDDNGRPGGLRPGSSFVIAGDLNSDPQDGDSLPGAANQLTENWRINNSVVPSSRGAVEAAAEQGEPNNDHRTPAKYDTADFAEPPGNLRIDYALPSRNLPIKDAGVFWPTSEDPLSRLTGKYPFPSSDHRLVWVDVRVGSLW